MPEEEHLVREEIPAPFASEEIWKQILDRNNIPETIIHNFKGEIWAVYKDVEGRETGRWESRGKPLMNDDGIRFFSSYLFSCMSVDKIATNITDEEVRMLCMNNRNNLVYIFMEYGDQFEIEEGDRSYVLDVLDNFFFMNLTASRRGTMLNALKPSYQRMENVQFDLKKKSFAPSFLGGFMSSQ